MAREKDTLEGADLNRMLAQTHTFVVRAIDQNGQEVDIGDFTKVSGIEIELELESYREGGYNDGTHMYASLINNSRLTLEYGVGYTDVLLDWFEKVKKGQMVKYNLEIVVFDATGLEPLKKWQANKALPVKFSGPSLDSLASQVAISRLEFIHSGLTRIF